VRRDSVRAASWTVAGLAKVQGDVDVETGTVEGLLSVGGRLAAGRLRARGTLEAVGVAEVREELAVDGTARFASTVHAGDLDSAGSLRAIGAVTVDRALYVRGSVEAPSIAARVFDLDGSAEVLGDVTAAVTVRGRFRADSRLGSVRANRVELHGPPTALVPTLWRLVFGGNAAVHVERIEAESVELSAVDVDLVHAPAIVLGAGAHVTTVEGTVVRRHPSARVGPESRSPPPHGLSR
jgi:cytoskeletal protein CcmA (bactofilin family)